MKRAGERDEHNWPTTFVPEVNQDRQDYAFAWWLYDRFELLHFETLTGERLVAVYRNRD